MCVCVCVLRAQHIKYSSLDSDEDLAAWSQDRPYDMSQIAKFEGECPSDSVTNQQEIESITLEHSDEELDLRRSEERNGNLRRDLYATAGYYRCISE